MQATMYKDKLGQRHRAGHYGTINGVDCYTVLIDDNITGDSRATNWSHIHRSIEAAQRELDEHARQKAWTAISCPVTGKGGITIYRSACGHADCARLRGNF